MMNELLNKQVTIHFSAIQGLTTISKGNVFSIENGWLKLACKKSYEMINLDKVIKIVISQK